MIGWTLIAAAAAGAAPIGTAPTPAAADAALGLIERDWVLAGWALKQFDADGDIRISREEAAAAADAFRRIADSDADGRVTPAEYRAAREFILARY